MTKFKFKNGYECEIDEKDLEGFEVAELFFKMEDSETDPNERGRAVFLLVDRLFKDKKGMYDSIRNKDGVVPIEKPAEMLFDLYYNFPTEDKKVKK